MRFDWIEITVSLIAMIAALVSCVISIRQNQAMAAATMAFLLGLLLGFCVLALGINLGRRGW